MRSRGLRAVDDATWAADSASAGAAQPLARLRWLGGLLAGKGALLPGHDPDGRYVLNKWPQTEREYPKHFRIATAMMKGPATLAEIAAASGIRVAEVVDFVNANLATGYAESFLNRRRRRWSRRSRAGCSGACATADALSRPFGTASRREAEPAPNDVVGGGKSEPAADTPPPDPALQCPP